MWSPSHVESEEEEDKWQSRMLMVSAEPWVLGFSFELSAYPLPGIIFPSKVANGPKCTEHMLASRSQLEEGVVL